MGNANAWLKHQACESSDLDVCTHPIPVNHDKRAVDDIEPSLLKNQGKTPVLDGNGTGQGYSGYRSHADCLGEFGFTAWERG